ncbi:hypothetical protein [Thalassolituus oleivorans]|uniref:hypothetical protein n=1 Tax=Thalassolituus oleivorans TaxID=187493 RepID=UPI0030C7F8A0
MKLQGAYKNLLIFSDKRTNEGVVFLSPNRPSREVVRTFVDRLEERIKSIEYGKNLSSSEMTVIYEKHLEFLRSQEVISEKGFEDLLNRVKTKAEKKVVTLVSK